MAKNLKSVKAVAELGIHSASALRNLVHAERQNGWFEARVVYRLGRKVLIDVDAYYRWIDAQQEPRPTPRQNTMLAAQAGQPQ